MTRAAKLASLLTPLHQVNLLYTFRTNDMSQVRFEPFGGASIDPVAVEEHLRQAVSVELETLTKMRVACDATRFPTNMAALCPLLTQLTVRGAAPRCAAPAQHEI